MNHLLFYLANNFPLFFIIGLIFTLLGIGLGWLLWRKHQYTSESVQTENDKLTKHYQEMDAEYERMSTEYARIRNGGNSTDWRS